MQGGKVVGGTVRGVVAPSVYCAMADAGYDFIWTEMQHEGSSWAEAWRAWATCPHARAVPGVRVAYTAGEAIGPDLFTFYRSIGVNLKQLYGSTETAVFVCLQPDHEARADTVGVPCRGVEIRVADNGEILVKSPGLLKCYYKNDKATEEVLTADGWYHTSDAGFIDAHGHLKIIDRVKDVGRIKGGVHDGAMFAPKYVENKLKFFPHIKEAVCFGDRRDRACAFINFDMQAVGNDAAVDALVGERRTDHAGSTPLQRRHRVEQVRRHAGAGVGGFDRDLVRAGRMAECHDDTAAREEAGRGEARVGLGRQGDAGCERDGEGGADAVGIDRDLRRDVRHIDIDGDHADSVVHRPLGHDPVDRDPGRGAGTPAGARRLAAAANGPTTRLPSVSAHRIWNGVPNAAGPVMAGGRRPITMATLPSGVNTTTPLSALTYTLPSLSTTTL